MKSATSKTLAATLTSLCMLVATLARVAHAGPINPPSGPVAPTPGPEPRIPISALTTPGDADSLFKITQGGSYYLTGNVAGVAGKHGIEIASWGVTIDLNGFELNGVADGTLDGITIAVGEPRNITVLNGSVRSWDGDGVSIAAANGCRVEGLVSADNGGDGLSVGDYATVSRCSSFSDGGRGILVGFGGSITNCTSASSGSIGIVLGTGSTMSHCTSYFSGSHGISAGLGCSISHCTVNNSTGDGFRLNESCMITASIAANNGQDGIEASSGCVILNNNCRDNAVKASGAGIHTTGGDNRIEGNNCSDQDRGIDVDASGNVIIRNTCSRNFTDWSIAGDNIYGVIVDRRIPETVPFSNPVNGFSAGSTLGNPADPNANYSY